MVVPASRILDFSEAPIVDIAALIDGDPKGTQAVVRDRAGLRASGSCTSATTGSTRPCSLPWSTRPTLSSACRRPTR
jgi:hypothetical protein